MNELYTSDLDIVFNEDKSLIMIAKNGTKLMWHLRTNELTFTIEDQVSKWVTHLMEKSWVDISTLYHLAQIINKLHPENNINWFKTFFKVESRFHSKTLESSNGSIVERVFDRIRQANGPWGERIYNQINNGLQARLRQLNLV